MAGGANLLEVCIQYMEEHSDAPETQIQEVLALLKEVDNFKHFEVKYWPYFFKGFAANFKQIQDRL